MTKPNDNVNSNYDSGMQVVVWRQQQTQTSDKLHVHDTEYNNMYIFSILPAL